MTRRHHAEAAALYAARVAREREDDRHDDGLGVWYGLRWALAATLLIGAAIYWIAA